MFNYLKKENIYKMLSRGYMDPKHFLGPQTSRRTPTISKALLLLLPTYQGTSSRHSVYTNLPGAFEFVTNLKLLHYLFRRTNQMPSIFQLSERKKNLTQNFQRVGAFGKKNSMSPILIKITEKQELKHSFISALAECGGNI